MSIFSIISITFLASILAGCASAAAQSNEKPKDFRIDITPLTAYSDDDRSASGGSIFYHNAYTRLTITGEPFEHTSNPETRASSYIEGHWLRRYLIGLKHDISLTVKMRSGSYEETISLVTLSSSSDRNGSSWNRDVVHDASGFPWFLVSRNASSAVPRIAAQGRITRAMESGVATATLQATLAAIRAVSPQSTVVTSLSEPATRERASAIDQIISKLFVSEINETHHSDRSLVSWSEKGGVRVALKVPRDSSDGSGQYDEVGSWTIRFAPPRPSLFSEWHECPASLKGYRCAATRDEAESKGRKEKNADNILGYPLIKTSSGVITIRKWILQEDWYTSAQTAFTGNELADTTVANNLCLMAKAKLTDLGINELDATLVSWAAITSLPPARAMHLKAWEAKACKAIMNDAREKPMEISEISNS